MKHTEVTIHITGEDEKGELHTTTIFLKEKPGETLNVDYAHIRPFHKMTEGDNTKLVPSGVELFQLHAVLTKPLPAALPAPKVPPAEVPHAAEGE